jgi:integrase
LLERKASGAILAFYRERTVDSDKRMPLGILTKKPTLGSDERTLNDLRAEALRVSAEVGAAGGVVKYQELLVERGAIAEAERADRKRRAEVEARRGTFGELMDAYVESLERAAKVSAKEIKQAFQLHVSDPYPELVTRIAAEIEPEDIQFILAGVLNRKPKGRGRGNKATASASNGMRTTADKLRRYLRAAFSHAAKAHLSAERLANDGKNFSIRINPVRDIPVIEGAGRGDTESLSPAALGELLRHLDTLPARSAAIANALIYFGGQRLRQLCAVTWDCVTDDTIALLDAKGRKSRAWDHLLPITPRIKEVIAPLLAERAGPGPFALTDGKLAHPDTLSELFTQASRTLAAEGRISNTFSWKHVRVTAETLLAAQGVTKEIRAWLLSHGRSGVQEKHYDRYSYLPEKRAALENWGRYLDKLKSGERAETENVVLLVKKKV